MLRIRNDTRIELRIRNTGRCSTGVRALARSLHNRGAESLREALGAGAGYRRLPGRVHRC